MLNSGESHCPTIRSTGSLTLPVNFNVRANTNRRITTWLDAQHQYEAIEQRAVERPALHAVAVITAMVATVLHTRTRPTLRRGATGVARAAAGPAPAQDRAGREQVRP
jgi:hypothetical protein